MPTDYDTAYKTITDKVEADWATGSEEIMGYAIPIRYAGVEKGPLPDGYFARFSMLSALERQRTFRNGEDQRYVSAGVIYIQVFGPRQDEVAAQNVRLLSSMGKKIFRGKSFDGCIRFDNVRVVTQPPEPKFLRENVTLDYEFDEIG